MAEARRAFLLTIADADHMDHREVARRPLGEKARFDRCEHRLRHAVAAARSADQHVRVGLDEPRGFRAVMNFIDLLPRGWPEGRAIDTYCAGL